MVVDKDTINFILPRFAFNMHYHTSCHRFDGAWYLNIAYGRLVAICKMGMQRMG